MIWWFLYYEVKSWLKYPMDSLFSDFGNKTKQKLCEQDTIYCSDINFL